MTIMKRLFIAIFMIGLLIPAAAQILFPGGSELDPSENRNAARFPSSPTALAEIQDYPGQVDAWLMDHFGLRSLLVRLSGAVERKLALEPGISGNVVEGRDGWLFLAQGGVIDDFSGSNPFADNEAVDARIQELMGIADLASRSGAKPLVAIFPNKSTIYPEYMPTYVPRAEALSRGGQLAERNAATDAGIVFAAPVLLDHKDDGQLFYKSDTHWNALGAFYGYQSVMEGFKRLGLDAEADRLEDFRLADVQHRNGDLARMLNLEDVPAKNSPRLVRKDTITQTQTTVDAFTFQAFQTRVLETDQTDAPSLLILGDSFSEGLLRYFAPHFSRIVLIHHQFGAFDPAVFETYPSDYVLIGAVERTMLLDWQVPTR